jgi:hypothetical protein
MANDLFSALRTYLMKVGNGEKTPQELAAALNTWARESGEAVKARVEEEVKKNVSKMGFAKESDLLRLERELSKEITELKQLIKARESSAKEPVVKETQAKKNGAKNLHAKTSISRKPTSKKSGKK